MESPFFVFRASSGYSLLQVFRFTAVRTWMNENESDCRKFSKAVTALTDTFYFSDENKVDLNLRVELFPDSEQEKWSLISACRPSLPPS